MSSLMLINPRSRTKKTRSAAQKAATRRMVAANRSRTGAPAKRRVKRRKNPIANPVGLARVRHSKRHSVARRSHHVARRRRNPISMPSMRGLKGVTEMAKVSLQGAGGALLVNTALNYIPGLPAMLKSGNGKYLARAGLAVAIGVFGGKIMPHKVATNMAVGAMTVALHDLLLGIASQAMPKLQLGDVGDYDSGVSAYVSGDRMSGMGDMGDMGAQYDTFDQYGGVGEYVAY